MPFETYLKENGYSQQAIECVCPHCVTVADFAVTHLKGSYILVCQDSTVLLVDGRYIGFEGRSDEIVLYYYEKEER